MAANIGLLQTITDMLTKTFDYHPISIHSSSQILTSAYLGNLASVILVLLVIAFILTNPLNLIRYVSLTILIEPPTTNL